MPRDQAHLRFVISQDGAAILNTKLGSISILNSTGAYIWEALQQGGSPETIARSLSAKTGEQLVIVDCDVKAFLESLDQQHLMPYRSGGSV